MGLLPVENNHLLVLKAGGLAPRIPLFLDVIPLLPCSFNPHEKIINILLNGHILSIALLGEYSEIGGVEMQEGVGLGIGFVLFLYLAGFEHGEVHLSLLPAGSGEDIMGSTLIHLFCCH